MKPPNPNKAKGLKLQNTTMKPVTICLILAQQNCVNSLPFSDTT